MEYISTQQYMPGTYLEWFWIYLHILIIIQHMFYFVLKANNFSIILNNDKFNQLMKYVAFFILFWCCIICSYMFICFTISFSVSKKMIWYFLITEQNWFLLLLLLKKIGNARPGEGDCHPISPKTPAPHYQPIEEKKRKGKLLKTKK